MTDALLVFLIASVLSFVGSLQAGLVNTAVVGYSLRPGPFSRRLGIACALGGALPELLYAAIALKASPLAVYLSSVLLWGVPILKLAGLAVTLGLAVAAGVYALVLSRRPTFVDSKSNAKVHSAANKPVSGGPTGTVKAALTGFSLGLANPQLLVFWFGMAVWLQTYGLLKPLASSVPGTDPAFHWSWELIMFSGTEIGLVLGAGAGAAGILILLAYFTDRFRTWVSGLLRPMTFVVIGALLMLLAGWQLVRL
jgi:hypothetical protein